MKKLHRFTRSAGRSGSEWFSLRPVLRYIGAYKRVTNQVWSPALTERTIAYGIQIGHVRISFSRTYRVWTDDKDPRIEKGFY